MGAGVFFCRTLSIPGRYTFRDEAGQALCGTFYGDIQPLDKIALEDEPEFVNERALGKGRRIRSELSTGRRDPVCHEE